MRRLLSVCILLLVPVLCAEAVPSCRDSATVEEQSWNPPDAVVTGALSRFYEIDDELTAALERHDMVRSQSLAGEYLDLAEHYRCNWNYGNAIHDGNSALGLVALSSGNTKLAIQYLLRSAQSPGSPQLDSFGPTMALAEALTKAGEREAVIAYLRGVHKFWRDDDGQVDAWIKQLSRGVSPNFEMKLL